MALHSHAKQELFVHLIKYKTDFSVKNIIIETFFLIFVRHSSI